MFPPGNTVSERCRRVGCSSAGPDFDPAILTVQTPTQNKQTDKNTMTLLYQNKSFCLHNICMCAVYIYYVYINTHACIYFRKIGCLYIKYIYL